MKSDLFSLDYKDFLRGLITAILAAALFAVYGIFSSVGFDVFTADWNAILHLAINGAFGGFSGYLFKRLISDDKGQVAGVESL